MSATATLDQMRAPAVREAAPAPIVTMGFGSLQSFELMQRAANLLASSTLVSAAYRKVIGGATELVWKTLGWACEMQELMPVLLSTEHLVRLDLSSNKLRGEIRVSWCPT